MATTTALLTSFPLPPSFQATLAKGGFQTAADVLEQKPAQLARGMYLIFVAITHFMPGSSFFHLQISVSVSCFLFILSVVRSFILFHMAELAIKIEDAVQLLQLLRGESERATGTRGNLFSSSSSTPPHNGQMLLCCVVISAHLNDYTRRQRAIRASPLQKIQDQAPPDDTLRRPRRCSRWWDSHG